jgi:hypothetical protein
VAEWPGQLLAVMVRVLLKLRWVMTQSPAASAKIHIRAFAGFGHLRRWLAATVALAAAVCVRADKVTWVDDSSSAFDVTVSIFPGLPPLLKASAYQGGSPTNSWDTGSLHDQDGWTGGSALTVDIDPIDFSLSTWAADIHAKGPDLSPHVAEGGSTIALFGASLIVLFVLRKRLGF